MSWPIYASDEIDAVLDVLRRGQGNAWSGPDVAAFEAAYAAYVGVPHAVALSNGTVALELGLRALGIGPGDEVLVTARSFMASASAIVAVGGWCWKTVPRPTGPLIRGARQAVSAMLRHGPSVRTRSSPRAGRGACSRRPIPKCGVPSGC